MPTTSSPLPKIASTLSLKKKPTMATGIMEMRMLTTYLVPSFHFHLKRSWKSHTISRQRMTQVLRTVATCTATVKARFSSPLRPKRCAPMARWPLLLTGKYSVRPCTRPNTKASNHSIVVFYEFCRVVNVCGGDYSLSLPRYMMATISTMRPRMMRMGAR